MNFKKSIDADVISLANIGWSDSRDDDEIIKYVKSFVQNNYDVDIIDELALLITLIIDDLLSDMQKNKDKYDFLKGVKNE